jgi:hypothetical protein
MDIQAINILYIFLIYADMEFLLSIEIHNCIYIKLCSRLDLLVNICISFFWKNLIIIGFFNEVYIHKVDLHLRLRGKVETL